MSMSVLVPPSDMHGVFLDNETDVTLVNNTAKTETITVPTGKRWKILSAKLNNADNVNRDCSIQVTDPSNNVHTILVPTTTVAANGILYFPSADHDTTGGCYAQGSSLPIVNQFEKIKFVWAAGGASAGGSAKIYLRVLELAIA